MAKPDRARFSERNSGAEPAQPDLFLGHRSFLGRFARQACRVFAGTMNQAQRSSPEAFRLPGTKSSSGMDWGSDDSGSPTLQWIGPSQQAAENKPVRLLSRRILNPTPAPAFDPGSNSAPLVPSGDPNFSPDDDQEQADMQALDARLSNSGNIWDAVALYNALRSRLA
jgi:hypothetical protein